MRKVIVTLGVLMLVVILPAGSWYYLQTGLNYRKEALRKLEPKGDFNLDLIANPENVKSKTVLYQLKPDREVSIKILEQYHNAETFLMTTRDDPKEANQHKLDSLSISNMEKVFPNAAFILVDTSNQIRNVYNGTPMENAKEVVSHISMVLPRKKDKDIKMKENSNYGK